jgi:hypothetical protein
LSMTLAPSPSNNVMLRSKIGDIIYIKSNGLFLSNYINSMISQTSIKSNQIKSNQIKPSFFLLNQSTHVRLDSNSLLAIKCFFASSNHSN